MAKEMITSRELIKYFADEIKKRERSKLRGTIGNTPYAPVFVVCLGDSAIEIQAKVAETLFGLWPQFENEIKFCGITDIGEYIAPSQNGDAVKVGHEDVEGMVSAMFGLETHFESHQYLNVYYILDTTDFKSGKELDEWDARIKEFKRSFSSVANQEFLFVLLNEDLKTPHKEVAKIVRNYLSSYKGHDIEDTPFNSIDSLYILSDLRSDNIILENWDMCCRIISSVIAVSNSLQTHSIFAMEGGISTIGYAREDKPVRDIGQIVVHETIDRLFAMTSHDHISVDDDVLRRLGITGRGTVAIFDDYADEIELPDPKIFPRSTNEPLNVTSLAWPSFDKLTMGTWTAYLEEIVNEVSVVAKGGSKVKEFSSKIRKHIQSQFSLSECIDLSEHTSEIRSRISPRNAGNTEDVLSAARTNLKYALSSSEALKDIFINVILELGKEAAQIREVWENLLILKGKDFAVREPSLVTFYKAICDQYFNLHSSQLRNEVNSVKTVDDQTSLLQDTIKAIIESNSIFSASFDVELEKRMQAVGKSVDTKDFIKSRLSGKSVYVYLQVPFALSNPLQNYVLMDTTTTLKPELEKTLIDIKSGIAPAGIDEKYIYFNTGNKSAAETLKFYPIDNTQLISGGGD